MKPPYHITSKALRYLSSVSEKIGRISAGYLDRANPQLRKQNKIRTIHSSLQLEGNTLSEQQITALLENKRVAGPEKDIREVLNAIEVYDALGSYNPVSEKSFLSAHKLLMKGLIRQGGAYRRQSVGIVKGLKVEHVAPPYENVPSQMKNLFSYLKNDPDISLIKSCVFHYEMEFIHPFMDGNGRMGRLWQTVILMKDYPLFEFLPFETLISHNQDDYYRALSQSDKQGKSTVFIEYMLGIIDDSLSELLSTNKQNLKDTDRLDYFMRYGKTGFSRKDYMTLFQEISGATASRDLKKGVDLGLFKKKGDKKTTLYYLSGKK